MRLNCKFGSVAYRWHPNKLTLSQSFIFGDSNWKFCKVGYPAGTQKPDIQVQTVLTWDFFKAFIFYEKNQSLLDYKNYVFANRKIYKVS